MTDCKVDSSDGPKIEVKANLPEFHAPALEENEEELFKMRAKLYRWAIEADPPQWKERGTGDVKFLQHQKTSLIRLLMRRDKTFKVCANHYVDPDMSLKPHGGSDRAWVWNSFADFADGDEESQKQLFAIRFLNEENANKFKDKFIECQDIITKLKESSDKEDKCDEIKSDINIINCGIDKLTVKEASEAVSENKESDVNNHAKVPAKEECNDNKDCEDGGNQLDKTDNKKTDTDLKTLCENTSNKISINTNDEEDEPEK